MLEKLYKLADKVLKSKVKIFYEEGVVELIKRKMIDFQLIIQQLQLMNYSRQYRIIEEKVVKKSQILKIK